MLKSSKMTTITIIFLRLDGEMGSAAGVGKIGRRTA